MIEVLKDLKESNALAVFIFGNPQQQWMGRVVKIANSYVKIEQHGMPAFIRTKDMIAAAEVVDKKNEESEEVKEVIGSPEDKSFGDLAKNE